MIVEIDDEVNLRYDYIRYIDILMPEDKKALLADLWRNVLVIPFVDFLQFREFKPFVRFAHYISCELRAPERYIFDHELIYIHKGKGVIYTINDELRYGENTLLFIPPGIIHSFRDDDNAEYAHWAVHFDWERRTQHNLELVKLLEDDEDGHESTDGLTVEMEAASLWLPDIIIIRDCPIYFQQQFQQIVDLFQVKGAYQALELQIQFMQFILLLAKGIKNNDLIIIKLTDRSLKKTGVTKERAEITKYILKLHEAAETKPISNVLLPKPEEIYFSDSHFHRLFKEQIGTTPHDYFTHLRMAKAIHYLLEGEHPINHIAHLCGSEDAKYFGRIFKQLKGMSPSQYRNSFRIQR
ncbi:MAG TPA: AraC family transcriptional regulator [Bacilli bacterium]